MSIKQSIERIKKYKNVTIISVIALLAVVIILGIIFSKPGAVTTISESSLKEVIEISELSTIEYIYNSTFTVTEGKEEKYHVAYEGVVKAGFDFNDIKISEEGKKIIITIPDITINSAYVDENSIDCLFIKDKYETETILQEAYRKSIEDLEIKAESNDTLLTMARDNAKEMIKALIQPWEEQLEEGYTIEVR